MSANAINSTPISKNNDIISGLVARGASLSTILMASEILHTGDQADEAIQKMNQTRKVREAISNQIEKLTKHKATAFTGDKKTGSALEGHTHHHSRVYFADSTSGNVRSKTDGTFDTTKKEGIDAEILRLQGDLKDLDAAREIDQMSLQDIIGRKQRLVTMATNLTQTEHQSRMAVVRNLRG